MRGERHMPVPPNTPSLVDYVNHHLYNPYDEPFEVSVVDGEIILDQGEWKVVLNSTRGSITITGIIDKYYDIDRIKDIRDNFGEIYSVLHINRLYQERKLYE